MGEESSAVESILKFLDDGSKRIKSSPSRKIILVLGDSGTGKSALTHFLTSNEIDLISEKAGGSGYTIKLPSRDIICASTIESCTVTPQLMIDQKENQTYYDCPGFRDTRSVSHDIGTTFFVRKVMGQAEAIKVIFTVNYNSVLEGGSRHDFTKLVENVSAMFKDIQKYENSVCLVVNKVENVYEEVDGQLRVVPDEVMRQDIVEFLKNSKNNLQEKLENGSPSEKLLIYNQTINLINIFINEKDPGNPRVGIFRRPNKPGSLKEMKEFQAGKVTLQKMVYDNLKYTAFDKSDVRFTISENSKLYLNDIEKQLINNLSERGSTIENQLVEQYDEKAGSSTNVDDLLLELEAGREKLSNLKHRLSDEKTDAHIFIKELIGFLDDSKFSITEDELLTLEHFSEYLEFVETMTGSTSNNQARLQNTFNKLESYLDNSIKWFKFLIDLRFTFSEYNVQQNARNFSSIADEIRGDFSNSNLRNVTHVQQFLLEINDVSHRSYGIPNINKIDETKLRFFMELLEAAFTPMKTECQESKLAVKGWHILISDVLKAVSQCDQNVVEIFATNKIFVDADFVKKGGQLVMVSPEVEIVNNRKIILNGKDAPVHDLKRALTTTIAPGSKGADGLPGLPGGPGGELVVVVRNCKNCNNLVVSAIGGKGGEGQHGGDGMAGSTGRSPPMMFGTRSTDDWENAWRAAGFSSYCYNEANSRRRRELFTLLIAAIAGAAVVGAAKSVANANEKIRCDVQGLPGQIGGNGGNGGVGGEGGNAGNVSIYYEKFTPTSSEGPIIMVENGTTGAPGLGGNGGLGGYYGDDLRQTLKVYINYPESNTLETSYHVTNYNRAGSGMPGKPVNEVGLLQPKSIKPIDLPNTLTEFKGYVRNIGNSMVQSALNKFSEYFKVHERSKRSLKQVENVPEFGGIPFLHSKQQNIGSVGVSGVTFDGEWAGHTSPGRPVNYGLLNVQSSLLLVDTLIRKMKGGNKMRYRADEVDESSNEYAQSLAYNAHVPGSASK